MVNIPAAIHAHLAQLITIAQPVLLIHSNVQLDGKVTAVQEQRTDLMVAISVTIQSIAQDTARLVQNLTTQGQLEVVT